MPDITEPIPYGLGEGPEGGASVAALFSHGSVANMWFGGFHIAGSLNKAALEYKISKYESTPFGEYSSTFAPTLEESRMSVEGFYDNNTLAPTTTLEKHLYDNRRNLLAVAYFPGYNTTVGDPAYVMKGRTSSYSVETSVEDAAAFEMELTVSAPLSRGFVLKPDSVEVASGTSSSYDTGATRRGVTSVLSVSTVSGETPELEVKIQHSPDNAVWSDLVTFTTVNEMQAEHYSNANLTAERFLRTSWTMIGTSPSFTFNVAMSQGGSFK